MAQASFRPFGSHLLPVDYPLGRHCMSGFVPDKTVKPMYRDVQVSREGRKPEATSRPDQLFPSTITSVFLFVSRSIDQ